MGGGDDVSGNGALSPAAHLFPFPHPAARVIPPPTLGGGGTHTLQESIVRRAEPPTGSREIVATHLRSRRYCAVDVRVLQTVWQRISYELTRMRVAEFCGISGLYVGIVGIR